jgi:hypothetical protein
MGYSDIQDTRDALPENMVDADKDLIFAVGSAKCMMAK